MDNTSLTCVLLAVLVAAIGWYIRRIYTYWERRGVPTDGLSSIPFGHFGNVGKTTNHAELMKSIYDRMKGGPSPFCGVYSFHRPLALILDLNLIRKVMITDFDSFHDRGTYHNAKDDPLSSNMVSIEGQEWRDFRYKFATIFTSGKMKLMFRSVSDVGEQLVQVIGRGIDENVDGVMELKDLLASYTTDVIGVCAFGLDCNSLQSPDVAFRIMGKQVFEKPRNSPVLQLFISSHQDLARRLGCRIFGEDVEEFYMDVVKKTVAYRRENNVRRNDLLDMLLDLEDSGFGLTIEKITAEAFAFFLAGFGTTSTMMSFALYELALNADMQSRLRDEMYAVLAQHDGELSYESMADMTYLNQVFDGNITDICILLEYNLVITPASGAQNRCVNIRHSAITFASLRKTIRFRALITFCRRAHRCGYPFWHYITIPSTGQNHNASIQIDSVWRTNVHEIRQRFYRSEQDLEFASEFVSR